MEWLERARGGGGDALQIGQYQGKWLNKRDNHRSYLLLLLFSSLRLVASTKSQKQAYNFRNGQVGVHCIKLYVSTVAREYS